jgi:glycosyltransferase involved in cell wall biosynthesis
LRVLHVISGIDPQFGGPSAALVGLSMAQADAGHEVTVLATWKDSPSDATAERLRKHGTQVRLVGPALGALSRHPALAAAVDESVATADVVHVHALWEDVQHLTARSAQRRGVPYVIRPCGMLTPWSLRQGWLKKRLYMMARLNRNLHRAAALHFTSQVERTGTEPLNLRPRPIVEPNGVDLGEYRDLPPKGFLRQRFPQIANRPVIVFLGRIHPGKGLETLVPALARMQRTDAVVVVVGPDGGDGFKADVERAIVTNGVEDRVIFAGMLTGTDKVAALADADLFSLPSAHENFGISIVEALAAGTPVVISDQCGIHAEVTEAQVGAVVPLDAQRLAAELDRWLADPSLRAAAAERARPFVWRYYDWDQIARRWTGHYDAIRAAR